VTKLDALRFLNDHGVEAVLRGSRYFACNLLVILCAYQFLDNRQSVTPLTTSRIGVPSILVVKGLS